MDIIGYNPIVEIGLGFNNLIQSQDIPEGAFVLNWGCGFGDSTFVIRRCVGEHGRVIGIDYSAHNTSLARQNCGNFGYSNVTFFHYPSIIKQDSTNFTFQQTVFDDATFDIVVCNYLLNLIPIRAQILQEFHRVLKPNGSLILTDFFANKTVTAQSSEKITHKYLAQIHQDYADIIADSKINLLSAISSNPLMLIEDYNILIKEAGFRKMNMERQNPIDTNSGELLLYMENDSLNTFANAGTAFYKADLLIEK